ncbi:MAG: NAAT family transporter [Fusobacteria bacterium]|nr:NAAT family transporter [Fusobacteriota bacterium]
MNYILMTGITLFFIMDPLGNIPVFVSILNKVPQERRERVLRRELLIALIVALIFFFFGGSIVKLLGLEPNAISIGGGVVLFIIGIKMIFPDDKEEKDSDKEEPFIVPLAIPMFVGPSILAVIILIQSRGPQYYIPNLIAIVGAWAVSAFILFFSNKINKILGKKGLIATERLMGMLLIIIAVQMLLEGVSKYVFIH